MLSVHQRASAWDKSPSELSDEELLYISDPAYYIEKIGNIKSSSWVDVENKAKRLIADGQVFPEEKRLHDLEDPAGPLYITGTVVGDHSTYKCQIWTANSNPSSLAVRSWACQCTWNRYVWNRTRQWKKYEGRVCSHILALYWQAKSLPLDEESQEAMDRQKGKPRQEETLFDAGPLQLPIPNIQDRPERKEPNLYGFEPELQMSIQQVLPDIDEITIEAPDKNPDLERTVEQPAEQAQRPLELDLQMELQRQEQKLKELKQRSREKVKASSFTVLTVSSSEEIKDIMKFIELSLMEERRIDAATMKGFWGEMRGGLYPHPDAVPIANYGDGNLIYNDEDLGWDPSSFSMGSDKEERGIYGYIPANSYVNIISLESKDRLVLIRYMTGNNEPNHNKIDVWVPIKDIYLL